MRIWVVGAGGMLGSAIARRARDCATKVFQASPVPWGEVAAVSAVLAADLVRFIDECADEEWGIAWAAGSSVVASPSDDTSSELAVLTALLDALVERRPTGPGAFFLTSSAGGVYAGSASPPFSAESPVCAISPYGHLKLRQEETATTMLRGVVPIVIGRYSNLYGVQHNPDKGQGLIPLLCRATVRRTPLNLFVSMDTVRDYLYVDDAAAMSWQAIETAVREQPDQPVVLVIATGQPTTIAQLIATVQNVAHRRVPLALGTHPSAQHQAIDLRLVPSPELLDGQAVMTPLPSGIKIILDTIVGRVG